MKTEIKTPKCEEGPHQTCSYSEQPFSQDGPRCQMVPQDNSSTIDRSLHKQPFKSGFELLRKDFEKAIKREGVEVSQ